MAHNILITGGSGYLGGSLLASFRDAELSGYGKLFALVRNDDQAREVQQYGAVPLKINLESREDIKKVVVKQGITIVYWLIGVWSFDAQAGFIEALAEVGNDTGRDVHFLQTTGAKLFSSLSGHPNDEPLLDTDTQLYEIQKTAKTVFPAMRRSLDVNCSVIEAGERLGVKTYIFAPCIVYGEGTGFGNKISIQTVDIVTAAKAAGRVYTVDKGAPQWPTCHVSDNTSLYLQILRCILEGKDVDSGKNGYFLAASGSVGWNDLYAAMAKPLFSRGVVEDDKVLQADEQALERMAEGLGGKKETVRINIAGNCTFTADHGKRIGWQPKFQPKHILDTADKEVDLILREMQVRAKV